MVYNGGVNWGTRLLVGTIRTCGTMLWCCGSNARSSLNFSALLTQVALLNTCGKFSSPIVCMQRCPTSAVVYEEVMSGNDFVINLALVTS